MEPAFLKVFPNKDVARSGHGRQRRKCSPFTCDTCPRAPRSRRGEAPAPAARPQRPPHPAPTQAAGAPGVPRAQIPGLPRDGSQEPGRWRGEALPGPTSPPPSRPAGSGDSPPPETAEKLGRDAGPDPSPPPPRPPAGRPSELPTPRGYLPRALPARERGPREGARGEPLQNALRRRSPAAAPSAPPGHGPFLGHGRTGCAAWAPLAGPGGGLALAAAAVLSAPAPPAGWVSGGAARCAGNGRERGLAAAPLLHRGRPCGRPGA